MCVITVISYLIAAQAKLEAAGLAWITDDVLRNQVAYDNLRKIQLGDLHSPLGAALVSQAWLFLPLALMNFAVELGAPLALLGGRAARLWVLGALLLHWGIFALMAIVFPYHLLGVAYLSLFAVERWRAPPWLRTLWPRRRAVAASGSAAGSGGA